MGIFKNDDKQSSAFGFDEKSMAGKAVKAVRWIYAITGVLALVARHRTAVCARQVPRLPNDHLGLLLCDHGRNQAVYRCFRAAAAHRLARYEHHLQPAHHSGRRHNPAQPGLLDRRRSPRSWWSSPALAGSSRASCRFWNPSFPPTAPSPS